MGFKVDSPKMSPVSDWQQIFQRSKYGESRSEDGHQKPHEHCQLTSEEHVQKEPGQSSGQCSKNEIRHDGIPRGGQDYFSNSRTVKRRGMAAIGVQQVL